MNNHTNESCQKNLSFRSFRLAVWLMATVLGLILPEIEAASAPRSPSVVPKWGRFERLFESAVAYENPVQDVQLKVTFTAPSGEEQTVDGFWYENREWRVRFLPTEIGTWKYTSTCSDSQNPGLHGVSGSFFCTANPETTRFSQHGPLRLSPNRRYLMHGDTTPFFWLGDTAWNGALMSTSEEWEHYLAVRSRQKFTAIQWVATQWRAAPKGDRLQETAFTGKDRIVINPDFFKRLDEKADAVNKAGLLNAPVLLWAIGGGSQPDINPGYALPEDQAILLARYLVARWQAHAVVWILGGDGDYRGEKAARWRRIGRAVFGNLPHAPVVMHPGGMHWIMDEFREEPWLDLFGYQSGHGDGDSTLEWMLTGPPTRDWTQAPVRPFLNLEPPYENHVAYQSRTPISAHTVRRAIYWSLLNAPPAGVTYGGHGVWGWDNGTQPPVDHPNSGIPLPWQKALEMPAAEQMRVVFDVFSSIDFGRLRPAPNQVLLQPGRENPRRYVASAKTEMDDTALIYIPEDRTIELRLSALPVNAQGTWIDPRSGVRFPVAGTINGNSLLVATPSEGDWLLLFTHQHPESQTSGIEPQGVIVK